MMELRARMSCRRAIEQAVAGAVAFLVLACGGRATSDGDNDDDPLGPAHGGEEWQVPGQPSVPGVAVEGCVDGLLGASKVRGLNPAVDYEAVSLLELDARHVPSRVVEQVGRACPDSGVESLCLLEEGVPVPGYYLAEGASVHALVITREGEHTALDYWGLREVLGTIDTPNEASIIAWSEGYLVECQDLRKEGDAFRFPNDGECAADEEWIEITSAGVASQSAFCVDL